MQHNREANCTCEVPISVQGCSLKFPRNTNLGTLPTRHRRPWEAEPHTWSPSGCDHSGSECVKPSLGDNTHPPGSAQPSLRE